jgi:hypothetical protein
MRFVLYRASDTRTAHSPNPGVKVLFQKIYLRRVPLESRTATAVVAGLNRALSEIVIQFANDAPKK